MIQLYDRQVESSYQFLLSLAPYQNDDCAARFKAVTHVVEKLRDCG